MIVLIHSLFLLLQHYFKQYQIERRKIELQIDDPKITLQVEPPKVTFQNCQIIDIEANLTFDPPVYKQRYGAVQRILLSNAWMTSIKKIVDFGCAECGLFPFIKRLCRIEEILEVDIDEDLLRDNLCRLRPLTMDYIRRRTEPLQVFVLVGSISEPDPRLLNTDAVIAIEIIEHLFPDTLDALPYNIFGYIRPKIAIFTTPNADFNVLFPNFNGIRHPDHKFEWNRDQFESWAINIATRFPQYSVSFEGIGDGPERTKYLGHCSQMALFEKDDINDTESDFHVEGLSLSKCTCKMCLSKPSFGVCTYESHTKKLLDYFNLTKTTEVQHDEEVERGSYRLIETINYPFEADERTPEQKILDDLKYRMHLMDNINGRFFNNDNNRIEIPLEEMIFDDNTHFTTIEEARKILQDADYEIEECVVVNDLKICVVYELEMDNNSSQPISSASSASEEKPPYSEWTTISDGEVSEWGVDENTSNTATWLNFGEEVSQTEPSAGVEVINLVVDNLNLTESSEDVSPSKIARINNTSNDSGYYKSNTNLTVSTPSCSEITDGCSLNEELYKCDNVDEIKLVLNDIIATCCSEDLNVSDAKIKESCNTGEAKRGISKTCKVQPNEVLPVKLPKPHVEFRLITKICKDTDKNSSGKDALPGTSHMNKKNKDKKLESNNNSFIEICEHIDNVDKQKVEVQDIDPENITVVQHMESVNQDHIVEVLQIENINPDHLIEVPQVENISVDYKIEVPQVDSHVIEAPQFVNIIQDRVVGVTLVESINQDNLNRVVENINEDRVVEFSLIENINQDRMLIEIPQVENRNQEQIIEAPQIVENGDLANNNRDLEGNNYPNAEEHNEIVQENDNENVANEPQPINADVENRNVDLEDEDVAAANKDVDMAVEFASREALFDPNSQEDLLQEFDLSENTVQQLQPQGSSSNTSSLVLQGIGMITQTENNALVFPANETFPNWLLQMLIAEGNGDDFDVHDEPHFYCQGDGLGVHPSFIEVPDDEVSTDSSSGSSSTSGISTNDAADPSVSEVDAGSLPYDLSDVRQEQNSSLSESLGVPLNLPETPLGNSSGAESPDEFFDTIDNDEMPNNQSSSENKDSNEK